MRAIIDTLLMLKVLPNGLGTETNSLRRERNKLAHGTLINPTIGNTKRVIALGRTLMPIKNS